LHRKAIFLSKYSGAIIVAFFLVTACCFVTGCSFVRSLKECEVILLPGGFADLLNKMNKKMFIYLCNFWVITVEADLPVCLRGMLA